MSVRRALVIAVGAGVLLGAGARGDARAAAPEDLSRARALDQQGVRAYREERYNDAIRFFEQARKLGGPASEIWNIAKCQVRLDEPEDAADSIEEYLNQKGLSAADRNEAEQQLHELQRRHSTLAVASSPSGATVYLEGHRWAGVTPASIDIPPGEHKVTLELAGHDPYEKDVEAKYGRAVIVEARLSRNSSAPPPPPSRTTPDAPNKATSAPHRLSLRALVGAELPRFGSIGGSVAPAGFLSASYVAIDSPRYVFAVGLLAMLTADSWSNTVGAPNTAADCGTATIPSNNGGTAFSAFLDAQGAMHLAPRWRAGVDFGVGLASYSIGTAGGDVFEPTCHASPGVEPALHFGLEGSYAISSGLRLLLSPALLEVQPTFAGTRNQPRDASGAWLRYSIAAGIAFDVF